MMWGGNYLKQLTVGKIKKIGGCLGINVSKHLQISSNDLSVFSLKSYRWMSTQTSEKKRFAAVWGNGDYGRLGLGNLDSQWKPKTLSCSVFQNESLNSIACGGAHTLFLTESGHVYATGLNDFGQLGISEDIRYIMEPIKVSGIQKDVVNISAGYYHSCAVTVDGELYIWGKNSNGQLGLGKKANKVVPVPTKVDCLNGITIKVAALASEHSIAVTERGEALSWGGGGCGRLGHSHQSSMLRLLRSKSEYTPRSIKELEGVNVKTVAAGLLHSACIDDCGSLFLFGEGAVDKLGFGKKNTAITPSLMSKLARCKKVACGGYHTCVVTSGGELYAWGSNEYGCLGIGSIDVTHLPERVEGPLLNSPVDEVSCGWKHTAAISEGNVFTWGWGGSHGTFSDDGHSSGGQLGQGSDVDYIIPTLVDLGKSIKAIGVSCGFNHTGIIYKHTED